MPDPLNLSSVVASRYRVERELGRGGMSSVYLAHDPKHGRKVAVKVMQRELAGSLGAERFAREIKLTAGLSHPHILPLLDSGEVDGYAYYVMPYVEGESLRDRLRRERQLAIPDALQIAREVADALAYAHDRDVVHRDIKPENILLSAGHAVVADFGIARALSVAADDSITLSGFAVGTPTYMSPEQLLGEAVNGRTDIYALGCVLFEMLTGEVPFSASTAVAMIARKVTGAVPAVRTPDADLPSRVEAVVQRALAREAGDRFQSAREFIAALDAARTERGDLSAVRPVEAPHNAVAVLAFASMSPDAEDEYLGDGISEGVMHALARVDGLRVVARTSAFAFKQTNLDVREIGKRLRVRRVVEGSVRRSGNRIRITAKLIDATTALEIWSERFDRRLEDLFDVEDEISLAVAGALKDVLLAGGDERHSLAKTPRAQTTSFTAYEEYLKGRYFWSMRTEEGLRRGIEHLERALATDPNFAPAHAALAATLATLGLYGMAAPPGVMPLARAAAERALALDGSLAEALTARGCVKAIHDWDEAGAEDDFARAIAADAQYPTAHQWYAVNCLVPRGRFEAARQSLARARELDPLSLTIAASSAAADYYERRYEDAIESSRQVLRLDEHFAMGHYFLGLAWEQLGRAGEALAALDRAAELSGSAEIMAAVAHARSSAGDALGAREILARLAQHAEVRYVSPVLMAQVELGLGDARRALALLHEAHAQRAADLIWLGVRPAFDPLRSHPEFGPLLVSMGLPQPTPASIHPTRQRPSGPPGERE